MQQPPAYGQQPQPGVVYPPQQVVVTAAPPPVQTNYVVQSSQDGCCSGVSEKFNHNGGLATGIIQLIIAVLSIILSGASYAFYSYLYSPYGIWSGLLFYLPAGILGIVSKNKSTCVITGYLVMSILSCLDAFGMIIYEGLWAGVHALISSCEYVCYSYYPYDCDYVCDYTSNNAAVAIHSVLAILAFVEFIVAIVGAAFCCGGLACCCASPTPSTTTTTTYYNNPGAQQHVVVAGQVPPQAQPQMAYPQK